MRRLIKRTLVFILMFCCAASGCHDGQVADPIGMMQETYTGTFFPHPTYTSRVASTVTLTPLPTFTPMPPFPVLPGTPLPPLLDVISPQNGSQITELAH
jgi:hypothetical protein